MCRILRPPSPPSLSRSLSCRREQIPFHPQQRLPPPPPLQNNVCTPTLPTFPAFLLYAHLVVRAPPSLPPPACAPFLTLCPPAGQTTASPHFATPRARALPLAPRCAFLPRRLLVAAAGKLRRRKGAGGRGRAFDPNRLRIHTALPLGLISRARLCIPLLSLSLSLNPPPPPLSLSVSLTLSLSLPLCMFVPILAGELRLHPRAPPSGTLSPDSLVQSGLFVQPPSPFASPSSSLQHLQLLLLTGQTPPPASRCRAQDAGGRNLRASLPQKPTKPPPCPLPRPFHLFCARRSGRAAVICRPRTKTPPPPKQHRQRNKHPLAPLIPPTFV